MYFIFTPNLETRWWFQMYFIFTPNLGENDPILTSIFFNGVGLTTNEKCIELLKKGALMKQTEFPMENFTATNLKLEAQMNFWSN